MATRRQEKVARVVKEAVSELDERDSEEDLNNEEV